MKGILFIISSPSGGGKGTLIREVLRSVPNIGYSVSFTTRKPRGGEIDGRDYHFVSLIEFEKLIENGEFLEYADVHGNFYGTSRREVERETAAGRDIILEIDVQGAESVQRLMPEAVAVFILPPSYAILRERLTSRQTESPADLIVRLRNAREEVNSYEKFDYLIVNDEIDRAAADLQSIVYAERSRRERQAERVREILNTFENYQVNISGE